MLRAESRFTGQVVCLLLPLAALVALAWTRPDAASPSRTPRCDMVDLQLCGDSDVAWTILADWRADGFARARANLDRDSRFIKCYFAGGLLLASFSVAVFVYGRRYRPVGGVVVATLALLGAAVIDARLENPSLEKLIGVAEVSLLDEARPDLSDEVGLVRRRALLKFSLFSVGTGGLVAFYLAACRVWLWGERRSIGAAGGAAVSADLEFRDSFVDELIALQSAPGAGDDEAQANEREALRARTKVAPFAREVFVSKAPRDLVGLALSGGGIRSATFGLGILMRLREFGLLRHVDYLSTVSGGGYVGGWLTRMRKDKPESVERSRRDDAASLPVPESPSIRHLRLFSNFLVPRAGLLQRETWVAVAAVLASLLPALAIGIAVIVAIQIAWLSTLYWTTGPSLRPGGQGGIVGLLVAALAGGIAWRVDAAPTKKRCWLVGALVLLLAACAGGAQWRIAGGAREASARERADQWRRLIGHGPAVAEQGVKLEGAAAESTAPDAAVKTVTTAALDWRLFGVGISTYAAAGLLILIRLYLISNADTRLDSEDGRRKAATLRVIDAILGGLLVAATAWCVAAGLWWIAVGLERWSEKLWYLPFAGSASASAAFAWLRDQLSKMSRAERGGGRFEALKPYVPQLLAYAALVCFYVGVAVSLSSLGRAGSAQWIVALPGVCLVLAIGAALPPARFGLHEFYRGRISRAFLGGGSAESDGLAEPQSDEQPTDDLRLKELPTGRPYHLVCCAANDVAGDPLHNLNRGARSAVVSRTGLGIGGRVRDMSDLRFSSALTASAAAFNSQMGANSVAYGPAVAFLMCALNLRLGLWAPHPESPADLDEILPGTLRFREMFNQTFADHPPADFVHLSDGGHFENLALYELVRRRCRYILVSDAGADPNVKFEDFGNAVRRIREDFGADIEIDLEPLRPDERGYSRQHVAVGTIRYDAAGDDFDVGVLVYFKPALTGDEPVDILNYKSLNPAFPHETTVDQFYDEAQWESYRSLGSHAAFQALRFLDGHELTGAGTGASDRERIPRVFTQARNLWYPTPPGFDERMVELNGRFIALEQRFASDASDEFIRQIVPEYDLVEASLGGAGTRPSRPSGRNLHLVLEMMQLIEDVWLIGDFEKNYSHPLMQGWINAFQRWTNSAIVRHWWAFAIPLFTPGMKRFAEEHLSVPHVGGDGQKPFRMAISLRREATTPMPRHLLPPPDLREDLYYLHVTIPGAPLEPVPVGWIAVTFEPGGVVSWSSKHFRMRPGMWSSGFGTAFLRQVIGDRRFDERDVHVLRVAIDLVDGTTYAGRGTGHRRERNDLLLFYKALGFELDESSSTGRAGGPGATAPRTLIYSRRVLAR